MILVSLCLLPYFCHRKRGNGRGKLGKVDQFVLASIGTGGIITTALLSGLEPDGEDWE